MKKIVVLLFLLTAVSAVLLLNEHMRAYPLSAVRKVRGRKTVADRLEQYGASARSRLAPSFKATGVEYPPKSVTLVGIKAERRMEVWVSGADRIPRHLRDYRILGMSGRLGPKLREGDMQVPEGIYRVESLNPNSLYHLALRVNYPNDDDQRRGKEDGRTELGSDIMIHGKTCSVGCLAMGDEAAEDLFVLAAETGIDNVSIILTPVDFRVTGLPTRMPPVPDWTAQLYGSIANALHRCTPDGASDNRSRQRKE